MTPETSTETAEAPKSRPKKAETARIARAYFEAVAARDVEGMIELWQPGGIGHIHGMAELRAPDGYRQWFGNLFRAFPDMEFEVLEMAVEADQAAVRWRATGTFSGDARFEGFIANGASVEMEGIDLLTIREGLLRELHAYTNGLDIARQLGAIPPAGSAADKALAAAFNLKTRAVARLRRD
jgi:predicted ester cyclase